MIYLQKKNILKGTVIVCGKITNKVFVEKKILKQVASKDNYKE
jgi:hypothetical protein